MARYDPGLLIDHRDYLFHRRQNAHDIAAAFKIDKRQSDLVEKYIAHVDHIGLFPEDHAVAVGMRVRHVLGLHFIAVQVQLYAVMIGQNRQRFLGSRGIVAFAALLLTRKPLTNMIMRQDHRARLAKIFIPAAMVAMPVRVDKISHRLRAQRRHSRLDLWSQRSKLVINQHRAVGTIRHSDITALPHQNSDTFGQFLGLDLDSSEAVRFLCMSRHSERRSGQQCQR